MPTLPAVSDFSQRVRAVLLALEPGEVLTYGEVAAEAGSPGAARAVGNWLRGAEGVPWHRVVGAGDRIVSRCAAEQARLLRGEGLRVDAAGRVTRRDQRTAAMSSRPPSTTKEAPVV